MTIIDYTTYNDIRGVLGVSDEELEDVTVSLEVFVNGLEEDLEDINVGLPSLYQTVKAIDEASRTDAQRQFYRATRLFATYCVARQLGSALPMFGPKDISDGKASTGRFADSPYRETLKKIQAEYDRRRLKLEEAFATVNSSTATTTRISLFGAVGLATDPVTG